MEKFFLNFQKNKIFSKKEVLIVEKQSLWDFPTNTIYF